MTQSPATDPDSAAPPIEGLPFAELHETHSGVVLLCGDRAYKVKKPVVTDFLDFGTHARREQACARELELNRRLSPDVYLGVTHLTDPGDGPSEPVLVMRRMPDGRRLSRLLTDPGSAQAALSALAHMLARFHDGADRGPGIDRAATVAALRDRWQSLLSGLTDPPIDPAAATRLTELVHRFLDGRTPLFDNRITGRHIVDGHGDLRAGDIYLLPDGFRVLDCLDFDDELRHVDRLDDIAFLAMDLEFLGHPESAADFVAAYRAITGDPAPAALIHHYIAYRAVVRAKVNCLRYRQGDAESAAHAVRHTDIALRHLAAGAIRLALVGGPPGTGKTTVAQGLADATDAVMLSSDHIRAGLRAAGTLAGHSGEFGHGAYRPEARAQVYATMLTEARRQLGEGRSVVLDASWTDPGERERAAALAADLRADLIELLCSAPQSVAVGRILSRTGSESEATPAIAAAMAAERGPWPGAVVLDTTAALPDTLSRALAAWHGTATVPVLTG
jgi:aminoglycoside phosphotransferase family enzyme/predicted kinase